MTTIARTTRRLIRAATFGAVMLAALAPGQLWAQQARFLAKEDIILHGVMLKVEPAHHTVPKDIATLVAATLRAPDNPDVTLPPFAPDAVVKATLSGPSFQSPVELTISPNASFSIPPLSKPGLHSLDNIRLVSNGEVILRGTPERATIDVIEQLLVTQVTARPLTAAEIRERGIVFNRENFQAYNFTAAFAIEGTTVNLEFPILLPSLQNVGDVNSGGVTIPAIQAPGLQSLKTIIPDTLQIQRKLPNLSVVGFTLKLPELQNQNLVVAPIPAAIVFPGNIGFLNQYFSVMLMVSNAAPAGSNLAVSELTASIVLPPGKDGHVGSGDDPLAMAQTSNGQAARVRPVGLPGPDGRVGTGDDIGVIAPGETGSAEYLVEGRREGSHVVEMRIQGTLNGLPVGPVPITGLAAGSVLVRNPNFTLTFLHPEVVTAGEQYTLDVTVTNTSSSPANFVSLNLLPRDISGATLVGSPSQAIESIPPGDSATVAFTLVSRVTGKVTAATLDADANVAGQFSLKHAVGELGTPLSPESLVLPKEARDLPPDLRAALLGLLGKAWAVATAPAAALPPDVKRFSRQIVLDMSVSAAEAGLRIALHEPVADSTTELAMDVLGSAYGWLPARYSRPQDQADLQFAQANYEGFDDLRRRSIRGDAFADAVAKVLAASYASSTVSAFHEQIAEKVSYRPGHISVMAGSSSGPLPFALSIVDGQNRRIGGTDASGKVVKQIPFGDYLVFRNGNGGVNGQLALLAAPAAGQYTIRLEPVAGVPANTPFSLSIVVPRADGTLRHVVFDGLTGQSTPSAAFGPTDPYRFTIALASSGQAVTPSVDGTIVDPPPSVISVVQQAAADLLVCEQDGQKGPQIGRVVAVLFSEQVTAQSVQDRLNAPDITSFLPDANRVVGVALQPGGRIAFLALRDPFGRIPRNMTVSGVKDLRGHAMSPQTIAMESTVTDDGARLSGRVLQADGTPIPFANVRLFYWLECGIGGGRWVGVSSKSANESGQYSWDHVLRRQARIIAINPETDEFRDVRFSVQHGGQELKIDVVMLGRGTVSGRTLDEAGRPLRDTNVRITSLTDQSQYGAITDINGAFSLSRIPVGNVLIEAVNTTAKAKTFVSDHIPFAGAAVTRDLVLQKVETTGTTVKYGNVSGHVLRRDTLAPVSNVPVIVYYLHLSQPGVSCPGSPAPSECAVALVNSDANGAFAFTNVVAGKLRIATFDQATYQHGQIEAVLAPSGSVEANVLLAAGLGTVRGVVLDAGGNAVQGARVGGGLSLTTTSQDGAFTLTDVPVGRSTIVAVSDQLATRGSSEVNIVRAGEQVNVTVVLEAIGGVAGVVRLADQAAVVPNVKVFLFKAEQGSVVVVGSTTTNQFGAYSFARIPVGDYVVSSAKADFSDGNVAPASVKFLNQTVKADITFRGGAGKVTGKVFAAGSETPLRARVGVSGEQPLIAGGQVLVGFRHVQNFKIVDTNFTTGQFTLAGVWRGPFTLRAAGQFSPDPVALEGVMPTGGATVEMNVTLQPTSEIGGRVVRADGAPAAGVVVKYKSDAFKVVCATGSTGEDTCESIPQGIQETTAVTDGTGKFGFPLVNAGTFTLMVDDPAAGTAQIRGSVKAGEQADVSLQLLGRAAITVKVLGANGTTPIAGAEVTVQQLEFPKKSYTAAADGQGVLVIDGADTFTEGAFVITARDVAPGGTGASGRAAGKIVKDGEAVVVPVYLANQTGIVYGLVQRSDGLTAVSNAEVVISGAAGPLAYALTDGDGLYRVEKLPLGPVSVDVFEAATARRGFANGRLDFDGQELPINVRERALGVVRGSVLELGSLTPLKGWEVTLSQIASGGRGLPALKTSTSLDGTYSFPGVSEGAISLTARRDGISGFGTANGAIDREGQVVEIPLLARIVRPFVGGFAGRVLNADGSPSATSQVDICRDACGQGMTSTVPAGSDGSFALGQLPLGRYQLRARAQGSVDTGSTFANIDFDGQIAGATIHLMGLRQITGQVLRGGQGAPNVDLRLDGDPGSGCTGPCFRSTGPDGKFTFVDVPARRFTITATDTVTQLKGSVGDVLNPGEPKDVTIVLEPSGSLTGRVRFQNGLPASGVIADLQIDGRHLFTQSGADGTFTFEVTKLGAYTLSLEDPAGTGRADKSGTIAGAVDAGDLRLDETPPAVGAMNPEPSSAGALLDAKVRLTFTEKIEPGSAEQAGHITVSTGTADVPGTVAVSDGDTVATFSPLAPLSESTRYTVRVKSVKDLLGRAISPDYIATFTTADLTPPVFDEISPAANTTGAPLATTVRLKLSEAVDPTKTVGTPIVLTGPDGPVAGESRYLFGNTVVVFVPTFPLAENRSYQVTTGRFGDLAGRIQAESLTYTFATTDRTLPTLQELRAPARVIQNGSVTVEAVAPQQTDIAFVDFFINGVLSGTDTTWPFTFGFQALPAFGTPNQTITVSAIATDTSGNRGQSAVEDTITVDADQPPAVAITSPANGASAATGATVSVTVAATDDLGIAQIGYQAHTGRPQDAGTSSKASETFTFQVPGDAQPGTAIEIDASAVDTKGQFVQAAPVTITVLDARPPQVDIAGANSGNTLRPGQQATIVVTASDLGGVKKIVFATSGVVAGESERILDPAQPSTVVSFPVNVPSHVTPGQSIDVNVSAQDVAGNTATATRTFLIADTVAPTVSLRTSSDSLDIVAGGSVTVLADAADELGIATVELTGSGAFTLPPMSGTPPAPDMPAAFTIQVPPSVAPGAVLNLQARAFDTSKNVSTPAFLSLTVRAVANVTLPASAIVSAGETVDVTVTMPGGAPPNGQTVTFTTANANVASVTPASVFFGGGDTARTIAVKGESGGTVKLSARVQDVERASMTISVQGGIVSGVVLGPDEQPVSGVQVTVSAENSGDVPTTTDHNGRYVVAGLIGPSVVVKAFDPESELRGMASMAMNRANGYARIDVSLVPAGALSGTVFQAGGQQAVGESVLVTLFAAGNTSAPLATARTSREGKYEFPLVAVGHYIVDAEGDGRRGRSEATVTQSGENVIANVTYLARGVVHGTVLNAAQQPVGTAKLTFTSQSIFGTVTITRDVEPNGTFRFEDVLAGTFTIQARDEVTKRAATDRGSLDTEGQPVKKDLTLTAYGSVKGTVVRSDGTTTVANALVTLNSGLSQRTDTEGEFEFPIVSLGQVVVTVSDEPTRGKGRAAGTLTTHEEVLPLPVTLRGQGTIIVTVVDAADQPLSGAAVTVDTTDGTFTDQLTGTTAGENGQVIINRVLAGTVSVKASRSGLSGSAPSVTLAADDVEPVTVKLQPTASIHGTVLAPGGQATQSSGWAAIVRMNPFTKQWEWLRRVPLAEGGAFAFDGLTLSRESSPGSGVWLDTYQLGAYDADQRLRALVKTPILLTEHAQTETRTMEFVAVNTVKGKVINPNGTGAGNVTVEVRSLHPDFGRYATPKTEPNGDYLVENFAVGPIAVSAASGTNLLGENAGTLTTVEPLTLNISLQNNATTLPKTLFDANGFDYDVQTNGSMLRGKLNTFFGTDLKGGSLLEILRDGTATAFTGGTVATQENQARELAVRQTELAGLTVTRKVFVPRDGYFVRYLEILTNPTPDPISAAVRVTSHVRGVVAPTIVTTSNGDAVLDIGNSGSPDRWVIVDDADQDPFDLNTPNSASLAFTFDGADVPAARTALSGSFTATCAACAARTGNLSYEWAPVTIPSGGSVAFMHFVSQQVRRASALASAERLAQLPPEAIAGLAVDEIAMIRNFVVPEGGSTVAPLPSLTSTVTGLVTEADGNTLAKSALVWFKSNHPIFARSFVVGAHSQTAAFTFTGTLPGTAANMPIPAGDFTLTARHPLTNLMSAGSPGSFEPNATTAKANAVFTNLGLVTGSVQRPNHTPATDGLVTITAPGFTYTVSMAAPFAFGGVPPGNVSLVARVTLPANQSGTPLQGTLAMALAPGQVVDQDVELPAAGAVSGTVRLGDDQPAIGLAVTISNASQTFTRETKTSGAGQYTLSDVPVGNYSLRAVDPVTKVATVVPVSILADTTVPGSFKLVGNGSIKVQVNYARGGGAPGATVRLQKAVSGSSFELVGTTDAAGQLTIVNVPVTGFVVRAAHPDNSALTGDTPGNLTQNGQQVDVTVTLPPAGTIFGKVTFPGGREAVNASVQLQLNESDVKSTRTDGHGNYALTGLLIGAPYSVYAINPEAILHKRTLTNRILTSDAEQLETNIVLPARATVKVTVLREDGSPYQGAIIDFKDAFDVSMGPAGTTDADGVLLVADVAEGRFDVNALDAQRTIVGSASGTVAFEDEGQQVEVTIATLVGLPINLLDANGFTFDVQREGRLLHGSTAYDSALRLTVGANGATAPFAGATVASSEEQGRELSIVQNGLAGLNVTRKVFVPADGYFARYLEVVENPGPSAVTVNLSIDSALANASQTRVVTTSDGDALLSLDDTWLVSDDDAASVRSGAPTLAFAVQQTGAAVTPSALSLVAGAVSYGWSGLTIQPGQRAIVMHFAVQQDTKTGAAAAAQRLSMLPPEAIAGLSAEERAQIVNWTVPADGSSPVPPIPAPGQRTGSVSGRVIAGDGVARVPGAAVTFRNANYLFLKAATQMVTAGGEGQFTFTGRFVDAFAIEAVHPLTAIASPAAIGTFPASQTVTEKDVVFTNSGVIAGTVLRNQQAVTGGSVSLTANARPILVELSADGTFTVTGVPAGSYLLTANAAGGAGAQKTAAVIDGQRTSLGIDVGAATIGGRVTLARGGGAVKATVRIVREIDGQLVAERTTDGNGDYAFTGAALDTAYTVRAIHPTNAFVTRSTTGVVASADAQSVPVHLSLGASATARVTVVTRGDRQPMPGVSVRVNRGNGAGFVAGGTTNGSGMVDIANVFEPGFTVRAQDDFGIIGSAEGTVVTANDGGVVDVTIESSIVSGYVGGTLFAADGETPIRTFGQRNLVVDVLDAASGKLLESGNVPSGEFGFAVDAGPEGFILRAHSPIDPAVTVEATGRFTSRGQELTIPLTLPVGVIRGTVSTATSQAVPWPNVALTMTSGASDGETLFASRQDEDGAYGIVVYTAGDYQITAQDPESILSVTETGTIGDPTAVMPRDLKLPPAAPVTGTVIGPNEQPAGFVSVILISPATGQRISTSANQQGQYQLNRVPLGPFTVQACVSQTVQLCGTANGLVTAAGGTGHITIEAAGSISGTVRLPGDAGVVPSPRVTLLSPDQTDVNNNNPWQSSQTGTTGGTYSQAALPPGRIAVTAFPPSENTGGVTRVTLAPGASATNVDVTIGNATKFNLNLDGSQNGFRYDIRCTGQVNDGGLATGDENAFAAAAELRILGGPQAAGASWTFPCASFGELEAGGRQVALDARSARNLGVQVARKIFVPEAGGFARYLEVLTNPTAADLTVRVHVAGHLGMTSSSTTIAVDPAANGHTAVVYRDANVLSPAVGMVLGGSGAPVAPGVRQLAGMEGEYRYEWVVTVPAGQTRSIMHFLLQAAPDAHGVVASEAAALVTLSDSQALVGLTAAEKASIVNFIVP